jgi:hypothetical protein
MTNPLVKLNVSIQTAPAPSQLQKMGALVSQGGTITSPGTRSLLTQLSDLTPLLSQPAAITTIGWAGGTATVIAAAPHGLPVGQTMKVTIAGAVPAAYNGTYEGTAISPTTFTYPLASNPGTETTPGTWVLEEAAQLTQMATTFFAQGASQSVYVLELGPGDPDHGAAFLQTWIGSNPNVFYRYLVPREWDANATFLANAALYKGTEAKTYFHPTTNLQNYAVYAGNKAVFPFIEAPVYGVWEANALTSLSWTSGVGTAITTSDHGAAVGDWFQLAGSAPSGWNGYFQAIAGTSANTLVFALPTNPGAETLLGTLVQSQYASAGIGANEFSAASAFRTVLNYSPSPTNKVTPLNFAYEYGVTAFPTDGNGALITTLLNANVSMIGTGAAGGISSTLVLGGNMADGNPLKYWYSIDWAQINVARNVTAALINGANNPANPVDYNQFGINTLQQAAVSTMATGIGDGLVLNPVQQTALSAAELQTALDLGTYDAYTLVNAQPFGAYTTDNPNDYAAGIYNGFTIDYTPLRGFESITINLTVSDFAG